LLPICERGLNIALIGLPGRAERMSAFLRVQNEVREPPNLPPKCREQKVRLIYACGYVDGWMSE
jgi:hypothetical protein